MLDEIGGRSTRSILLRVSDEVATSGSSRRARRGGPDGRHARGDRAGACGITTSRPSRLIEHYRRAAASS